MFLACNGAEEKGLEPAHTHIRYVPTRRLGTLMANTDDAGVMLRVRDKRDSYQVRLREGHSEEVM